MPTCSSVMSFRGPIDSLQLTENFADRLQQLVPDIAREWCEPECVVDHGYAADGILLLGTSLREGLKFRGL
ncbi:MAG: hypothetical protein WAK33_26820 [Silvibacterium sp.]